MRSSLLAILLCTALFPLPSFGETMADLVRRGGLFLEQPFAGIWGGNILFTGKVTGRARLHYPFELL
jgi:hypothetical protein